MRTLARKATGNTWEEAEEKVPTLTYVLNVCAHSGMATLSGPDLTLKDLFNFAPGGHDGFRDP